VTIPELSYKILFEGLDMYSRVAYDPDEEHEYLTNLFEGRGNRFEIYCAQCGKETPHVRHIGEELHRRLSMLPLNYPRGYEPKKATKDHRGYTLLTFVCQLDTDHTAAILLRIAEDHLTKVGQYPSTLDAFRSRATEARYKAILTKQDASDLHRAEMLKGFGAHVGAFIYYRRIVERIINMATDEAVRAGLLNAEDLGRMRVKEKIDAVKGQLPDHLTSNRQLYSILSEGVHTLSDEQCAKAAQMASEAIALILEDEAHRQERQRIRETNSQEISKAASQGRGSSGGPTNNG
jgi:hypothetical protein